MRPATVETQNAQILDSLSKSQRYVMRCMAHDKNRCAVQIAGYGAAPYLSAARALVRKGLAWTHRTGWYGLTEQGRSVVSGNEKQPVAQGKQEEGTA